MSVLVEARDANLVTSGPLTWSSLEIVVRYNQVGSWRVTLPFTQENWELTRVPDVGVVVDWNGLYTFSGYAESWGWALETGEEGVQENLILAGADDLGLVANRLAYAQPGVTWENQTTQSHDDRGPAALETVIKGYVEANVLTPGDANRDVPFLTIAADQLRGASVSYSARFPPLMDLIRTLVNTAGPMGVRVVQVGTQLEFDVYVPRDLSQLAWFSRGVGNLTAGNLTDSDPTATNALVAGSGELTARAFVEVTGAGHDNPWQRVEQFVDQRQTADPAELTQAGEEAVAEGAGTAEMSITAIDLPRLRFGADDPANGIQGYGPGDTVPVEIRDGVVYTDIISEVTLTADADGERAVPRIGAAESDSGDETATAKLAAQVRDLERQLKRLQTGQ